jgi:hypothetical protein
VTDSELRALVREAVSRHFAGGTAQLAVQGGAGFSPPMSGPAEAGPSIFRKAGSHASHAMYLTLVNVGDACLIEPAVTCNHCGYCKSHGH